MNWISPHLAFDECSSGMKRKVHWDDKENGESEMELLRKLAKQMFLAMSRTTMRNHELKMF